MRRLAFTQTLTAVGKVQAHGYVRCFNVLVADGVEDVFMLAMDTS